MRKITLVLLMTVLLLACVLIASHGQTEKPIVHGQTTVIQEIMGGPEVLEDGTTVYKKIDTLYQTYAGSCDLCPKPLFYTWKESTGFSEEGLTLLGFKFHKECFGRVVDHWKKKIKFTK